MDQILRDIGNAISSVFSNEVVQLAFRAIGIYIVIIWLATAFWAYQDMKHRTANPILPYLAAALIVVFTPIFFIFAAILYRIIRPHERIGEAHERMLAEEAMLAEVEQIDHCTGCGRRTDDGWIVCPTCRTRLKRVCPSCGKLVGTEWTLCAWCGADFEPAMRPAAVGAGPYAAPSLASRPGSRPAPAPAARPAPAPASRPAPAPPARPMASPSPAPVPLAAASPTTTDWSSYERPAPTDFVGASNDPGTSRVAPMARPVRSVPPASAATVASDSSSAAATDPVGPGTAPTSPSVESYATAPTPSPVEPIAPAPAPRRRASTR